MIDIWSSPIINFVWILMAPAILVYLALTYWRGTKAIACQMDDDDEKFEEDLMAIYAPTECGEKEADDERE